MIYPIVVAVLIGFALSRGPEKPRVAFLNQVPEGTPLTIGGQEFDLTGARSELCERIECVRVSSRQEALEKVKSGEVLGALILPKDLVDRLQGVASGAVEPPTVKVLVNEEDPLKAQLVDDRISSLLTTANLRLSHAVSRVTLGYLDLLVSGGNFDFLGQSFDVLGLKNTERILRTARTQLPKGSSERAAVDQVIQFADLARENLGFADSLLSSVSEPIQVDKEVVSGGSPDLDTFTISVAATVTLMFVTVLLVAGSLALEREENAFARLTRGLVSPFGLLG